MASQMASTSLVPCRHRLGANDVAAHVPFRRWTDKDSAFRNSVEACLPRIQEMNLERKAATSPLSRPPIEQKALRRKTGGCIAKRCISAARLLTSWAT